MTKPELAFLDFANKGVFKVYKNGNFYIRMISCGEQSGIYKRRKKIKLFNKINKRGYIRLGFIYKGKQIHILIHRAIWIYFNGEIPEGLEINHKNMIKCDNRLSNLELVTCKENQLHSFANGRVSVRGTKVGSSKLTEKDVYKVRRMLKQDLTIVYIANFFKVRRSSIYAIRDKRNWAWL